jgi:hypothetical protein
MISRLRKALSMAVGAVLVSASLVAFAAAPAKATPPNSDSDCLIINSSDELVSGDLCSGDLVIPARVKTIKRDAFQNFDGAISFEANSQLTTVEQYAFTLGTSLRGITFPQSLVNLPERAAWSSGLRFAYLNASNSNLASYSLGTPSSGKIIVPRHVSARPISTQNTGWQYISPFEIDCNTLTGDRDFVASDFLPLELSNCKDPRNPDTSNPPNKIGFVLNQGLNQSVNLQSLDGSKSATVRMLVSPGQGGTKASIVQRIDGGPFSASVFGDLMPMPLGTTMSCQLTGSNPLPAGLTLSNDCQLQAVDTSALATLAQEISVNWTAHSGVANTVDVALDHDAPVSDWDSSGTVRVRLALLKSTQLTPVGSYQNLLSAATYSGSSAAWNAAVTAYRAIPAGQVPVGPVDPGIAATLATEQFEQGLGSDTSATSAIATFAASAAAGSTYLTQLQLRVATKAATNSVATFESNGLHAQAVKTQILDLPTSPERSELLARFNSAADSIFQRSTTQTGDTATMVYQNPYRAETFTVPSGVTRIHLETLGAQGSQGGASNSGRPDRAGFIGLVTGDLTVTPGQVLTIGVGEAASDAPADCLSGSQSVSTDSRIARGGSNPLGGYSGGNGGSPGTDNCGGYGGAGGAASVVKIGSGSTPDSVGTIVAGGSAGSAGSSTQLVGKIGLNTATARPDAALTNGQSALSMYRWIWPTFPLEPVVGGALAGGGGGAIGGASGIFDLNIYCGQLDYCATASSPGQNSTGGLGGLVSNYVSYTFTPGLNSNGRVTISYVVPPVVSAPAPNPEPNPGSQPSPTPTPSLAVPAAPTNLKVSPIWRGADVSWAAPSKDGGSPVTQYRVSTTFGGTCVTTELTCRLTGLGRGQKIEPSVIATNSVGDSPAADYEGPTVFTPLSINLWQVRSIKILRAAQLATLRAMLIQDSTGFGLEIRLVKNASTLSKQSRAAMLAKEVSALKSQLGRAGILPNVKLSPVLVDLSSQAGLLAKLPSVVLVVHKP